MSKSLFGVEGQGGVGSGWLSAVGTFMGFAGAKAGGGDVMANQAYLVGEKGPEMFVPHAAGTIIPHDQVQAGPGAAVYNFNVSIPPSETRRSGTQIAVEAQTQARARGPQPMSWIDLEFPPCIAFGALKNPTWLTNVVTNQGGWEKRNQVWSQARQSYDVSLAIRTATDYRQVLDHFHVMRGRLHSFPFLDHLDHEVGQAEGFWGEVTPGTFQAFKRYGTPPEAWDRIITRLKDTTQVWRSGSPASAGSGAGQYSLNPDTGRIVFVADGLDSGGTPIYPDEAELQWAGQFWTPCRYDTDRLPSQIVNRVGGSGDLLVSCESIMLLEVRE